MGDSHFRSLECGSSFLIPLSQMTGGQIHLYGPEYPHAVYDEVPDFKNQVKEFFDAETNSTANQTDKAA